MGALIAALIAGLAGITTTIITSAVQNHQNNQNMMNQQNINNVNAILQQQALQEQIKSNEKITQNTNNENQHIAQQNIVSNENIAKQNIQYQKEINAQNIEYQKAENEITRQREDNALQRKLADGLKAGLSPLGALGFTGANSSVLTSPQLDGTGTGNALNSLLSSNNSALNTLIGANSSTNNNLMNNNNSARQSYSQRKQEAHLNYISQLNAYSERKMAITQQHNDMIAKSLESAMNVMEKAKEYKLYKQQLKQNDINYNISEQQLQNLKESHNGQIIQNEINKSKADWYKLHPYQEISTTQVLYEIFNSLNEKYNNGKSINETINSLSPKEIKETVTKTIDETLTKYKEKPSKFTIEVINKLNPNSPFIGTLFGDLAISQLFDKHDMPLQDDWYWKYKTNKKWRTWLINQAKEFINEK